MKSRDFAYWLQGFFEVSDAETITKEQTTMIKKHLNLVFKHEIDPSMGDEKHQAELNSIHNQFSFPETEEEAIAKWGKKPSPKHEFNLHGWYDPAKGAPRC
jgi:hypothetical protein